MRGARSEHGRDAPDLVLRVFDLAPKAPDKSAQGNALGLKATTRKEEAFQPIPSFEGAAQL
jgi:hypothetical protein